MAGKKFTKAEIINSVYERTGMSRIEIKTVVDIVFDEIKEALGQGLAVELRGFGTFETRIRRGRQKARNPKTGESVMVTSHGTAWFRAGRELKLGVWNLPWLQTPTAGPAAAPENRREDTSLEELPPAELSLGEPPEYDGSSQNEPAFGEKTGLPPKGE